MANNPKPENVILHRVDMNEEILTGLGSLAKAKDIRLRNIQANIARSAIPMTQIVNDLVSKTLTNEEKQKCVDGALDGITFMANANASINQLRKDLVRPQLQGRFSSLCTAKVSSSSTLLFRDSLSDKIKAVNQSGRVTRGLYRGRSSRNPFGPHRWNPYSGWNRGRGGWGGGHQQYQGSAYGGTHYDFLGEYNPNNTFPSAGDYLAHESAKYIANESEQTSISDAEYFSPCRPTGTRYQETGSRPPTEVNIPSPTMSTQPVGEYPIKLSIYLKLDKWKTFKVGRVSCRIDRWSRLTPDRHILNDIEGIKIPFLAHRIPNPIKFSKKEREIIRGEIKTLIEKQVVEITHSEPGEFISNIFIREKKEKGKFRMILNLKELNQFVEYHHFKMDSLDAALQLIHKDSFLASLDFKDAY